MQVVVIGLVAYLLLLCILVLMQDFRRRTNISLAVFSVLFVAWLLGVYLLKSSLGESLTYARVVFVLGLSVAMTLAWFSLELVNRLGVIHLKRIFLGFGAIAYLALGVLTVVSPIIISDLITSSGMIPIPVYGPGYWLYIAAIDLAVLVVITMLVIGYRRANDGAKKQLKTVALTLSISTLFALGTNVLLPLITGSTQTALLLPIAAVIVLSGLSYAMARNGLLDIKLATIRSLVYVLSIATMAGIYFSLAYVASLVFFKESATTAMVSINPFNIILALILALIFRPIKRFFDRVTNKIFFRDSYNTNDFFARLTSHLSQINDLETLLRYSTTEISQTLKASFGAFLVNRQERRPFYISTAEHARKMAENDIQTIENYFTDNPRDILIVSMLNTSSRSGRSLYRLLLSYRIALVLPLFQAQDNRIIGYLFLGDHLSSQYTTTDIRALQTIADELTIAVENALSLQEVRDLNATLQQRIDNATRELRLSNAQLQRLDEVKDEFMSMASHQLRTPLTTIKGYISMVLEGDAGTVSADQKRLLGEAFASSERMVRLIGDFLNVSRLQTGKFIIEKQPTNLAKVVSEEIEGLAPNAAARGLKFRYHKPTKFPILNLDETKIRQVIMNFSDNAIYYSKDGGSIEVTLKVSRQDVIFMVKDSGIGVPADQQSELFQKFFRATNARKQRPDGTGVGLFLAKRVIDGHGGKIIFESKENKGSTFGFSLPIAKLKVTK